MLSIIQGENFENISGFVASYLHPLSFSRHFHLKMPGEKSIQTWTQINSLGVPSWNFRCVSTRTQNPPFHHLRSTKLSFGWIHCPAVPSGAQTKVPQQLDFCKLGSLGCTTWRIIPGLGYVVNNHGCLVLTGLVPFPNGLNGLQLGVTNHWLTGMILQVGANSCIPTSKSVYFFRKLSATPRALAHPETAIPIANYERNPFIAKGCSGCVPKACWNNLGVFQFHHPEEKPKIRWSYLFSMQ